MEGNQRERIPLRERPRKPAFPGYFADPFVFRHDGVYYALGTAPALGDSSQFPILTSKDLVSWELLGHALIAPKAQGPHFWAPEVAFHEGTFYLYYSVGPDDQSHQLRVATSPHPAGPYLDTGKPLLDPREIAFAIDPHPFRDEDGRWYLYYARNFLQEPNLRPGTAVVVTPLVGMTQVGAEFEPVVSPKQDWQRYEAGRRIYGGTYDWHTIEGPCVVRHKDLYYCLYSGGNWQRDNYGIDYVVGASPTGPFVDDSNPFAPRLLKTRPDQMIGPGHNSVVEGPDGTERIAYHAWDPEMTGRRLFIDRLIWTPDGPTVADA